MDTVTIRSKNSLKTVFPFLINCKSKMEILFWGCNDAKQEDSITIEMCSSMEITGLFVNKKSLYLKVLLLEYNLPSHG